MSISAKEVNELRKLTGAGLMDCKKAMVEAGGDLQAAVDILRKKGQKVSELRSGREANEGVVIADTNAEGSTGVVVHLSCETDFVARNEEFVNFAKDLTQIALDNNIQTRDELLSSNYNGVTVQEKVSEKVGAIGENISVSAFERLEGETVVPYIHAGYKIGVLISLSEKGEKVAEIGRDIAMQVAAMNPIAVDKDEVPQEVIDREFQIGKEQAIAEGKPDAIVEKIATGKLNKYFKENTLVNQQFVKDGSKTVDAVLKEVNKELKIKRFSRVALGSK